MKSLLFRPAVLLVLLVVLAGCGSKSDSTPKPGNT